MQQSAFFALVFLLLSIFATTESVQVSLSEASLSVDSKELWSSTTHKYLKGDTLHVNVADGETWNDWYIQTDANGYANTFHVSTRFKGANLFALVCCAGTTIDASCSVVGKSGSVNFDKDASLSCFANDNEYMYWNNDGSITATITVVSQQLSK